NGMARLLTRHSRKRWPSVMRSFNGAVGILPAGILIERGASWGLTNIRLNDQDDRRVCRRRQSISDGFSKIWVARFDSKKGKAKQLPVDYDTVGRVLTTTDALH